MQREENENYLRAERTYGKFLRRIPLPEGVDPASIQARYKVLTAFVAVPLIQSC
jgi:HSP20 family molecular chaperone IbpA